MIAGDGSYTVKAQCTSYFSLGCKWEWDYLENEHDYLILEKIGDYWYASK